MEAILEQEVTSTGLIHIPKDKPTIGGLFVQNGLTPIIDRIRVEAAKIPQDISTEKNRKAIRSGAYAIARSITMLDDLGKDLTADKRAEINAVNAERKSMREELEALQEEVRRPLTEWEEKEAARVAGHEAGIAQIVNYGLNIHMLDVSTMENRLELIDAATQLDWQEFTVRFANACKASTDSIKAGIVDRQRRDAQEAELNRLREEEIARAQAEREQRMRDEAAAEATRKAEERVRLAEEAAERSRIAVADAERREVERVAAAEKAHEAARLKAHEDILQAITDAAMNASKLSEADLLAQMDTVRYYAGRQWEEFAAAFADVSENVLEAMAAALEDKRRNEAERVERERLAQLEAQCVEAEKAVATERKRVAEESRVKAEADAKREANKRRCGQINRAAMNALLSESEKDFGVAMTQDYAKWIVTAVAQGKIPNVKISY